jgi:hypothetical protein
VSRLDDGYRRTVPSDLYPFAPLDKGQHVGGVLVELTHWDLTHTASVLRSCTTSRPRNRIYDIRAGWRSSGGSRSDADGRASARTQAPSVGPPKRGGHRGQTRMGDRSGSGGMRGRGIRGRGMRRWQAYADAAYYKVSVTTSDSSPDPAANQRVSGTSYAVPSPLAAGTYGVQVEAYDAKDHKAVAVRRQHQLHRQIEAAVALRPGPGPRTPPGASVPPRGSAVATRSSSGSSQRESVGGGKRPSGGGPAIPGGR